ncbi:MAG: hypothetical protein LKF45_08630 [Bifidobacterium tibiigranuli]|nr:hypothetical protein [Bifidobacterium tibiigranuli]
MGTGTNFSPLVFAKGSGAVRAVPTNPGSVTTAPVVMFSTVPSGVTAKFPDTATASSGMALLTVSGSGTPGLFGIAAASEAVLAIP